jgi:hypothetical protein
MPDEETREETQERHRKETLEFERIQAELEEYGEIMQACIEEAERTIQIWRGKPEMSRQDTEVFLAMMPAVSVALFEVVTGKVNLENNVKVLVMQSVIRLTESILKEKMKKIIAGRNSDSEDEGAEP